jgi:hypothetical protein
MTTFSFGVFIVNYSMVKPRLHLPHCWDLALWHCRSSCTSGFDSTLKVKLSVKKAKGINKLWED